MNNGFKTKDFLDGKCALKIEYKWEKEIKEILHKVRLLIGANLIVDEGLFLVVQKGVWCDRIEVVNEPDLPMVKYLDLIDIKRETKNKYRVII